MARDFKVRPTVNGVGVALSTEVGGGGSSAPALYTSSQMQIIKNPTVNTVTHVGMPTAPTLTATATTADDARGRWVNHATAATAGNASGLITPFLLVRRDWNAEGVFTVSMPTGAAFSTASVRYWVGFFSASPDAAGQPAISLAAFRYDSSLVSDNTAFWRTVTSNGTTQTVNTTSLAIADNAQYRFRIKLNTNNVEFYNNDALLFTHTTNLPVATTMLGVGIRVTALAAAARNIKWGRVAIMDWA